MEHDIEQIQDEEIHVCELHPERETELRCNRCGRYMCVQCAVSTPVGYRCRQCVREQDDKFFQGTNTDYLVILGLCTGLSAVGGTIALFLGWFIFALFVGIAAGGFIGQVARRITRNRVGRYSGPIAAGGVVLGALLSPTLFILLRAGVLVFLPGAAINLSLIVYTVVAAGSVYTVFQRRI